MNKQNFAVVVAVVAVVIAIASYTGIGKSASHLLGGITNYDEVDADALRVGGSNSTRMGLLKFGTCSLIASSFTVAASSTVAMDCAITGVIATDGVFAQFATSSQATFGGWQIRGASASSTPGFATISVVNGTGASGIIPASIASSTKFIVLRTLSTIPGL